MLLVTNGLLIGAFAAAATVSTARDSHLFHTWLRASEIARRRTERSELRSSSVHERRRRRPIQSAMRERP
jgi:hypothetical protein